MGCRSTRLLALVVALVVCTPTIGSPQISPLKQLSAVLPSSEGKILVFKYCVACHGPALIQKRLESGRGWPLNYWEDVISQMIQSWGATIEPAEVPAIARYLESTYGAALSTARAALEALPAGTEKDLLEGKCFGCHDRDVTARRMAARRDLPAPAWTTLLGRMNRYGARLSDAELSQLSAYLERAMASREGAADPKRLKALSSALPDRDGKNVVLAVCLSCHGPDELRQRIEAFSTDDPFSWERVVRRMQTRWEAPLDDGDVEVTVKYLNSIGSK